MRPIVFAGGPLHGIVRYTALPAGTVLPPFRGFRYVITDTWTVRGYLAEWDGQWC